MVVMMILWAGWWRRTTRCSSFEEEAARENSGRKLHKTPKLFTLLSRVVVHPEVTQRMEMYLIGYIWWRYIIMGLLCSYSMKTLEMNEEWECMVACNGRLFPNSRTKIFRSIYTDAILLIVVPFLHWNQDRIILILFLHYYMSREFTQ